MNKKVIATILALGMVAGAFAMMATPVKAADPMTWHFYDTTSWGDERLRDNTLDGCNPNGGVARWIVVDTPAEFPTDVTTDLGSPMPAMAGWIGSAGRAGMDYYVMVQTSAGQTNPTAGEPIVFFLEKDPNIAAAPQVYNPTSAASPLAGGTVPHGYIWAGADVFSWTGDNEPLPSGSPPTTFFEVLEMPAPDISAAPSITWAGVTNNAGVAGNTNANIVTWHLWESAADTGPWAEVGNAPFGTPINYALVASSWYSVSVTFTAGVRSTVLSMPVENGVGPVNVPPVVDSAATAPLVHDGNTVNEFVTLTASASDADSGPAATILQYSLDGGAWTTFTSPVVLNFPTPYTEGLHNVDVRAYDGADYSAVVEADFTITDTTAPIASWGTVPVADSYINQALIFNAVYEDFTAWQAAVAGSYFTYSVNGVPAGNFAWTETGTFTGSQGFYLQYTIPAGTLAAGDVITWGGQVRDTAATPSTTVLAAGGPITMLDPPLLPTPYTVAGFVQLYDGTGGVYTPLAATAPVPVTVRWWDSLLAAYTTKTENSDATGAFSIDIDNWIEGEAQGIEIFSTFHAPYGNNGYAWVPIDNTANPGFVEVNVVCGIPYEVVITAPVVPPFSAQAGIPFAAQYQILDRDGDLAQGYFSFEGSMGWTSTDPLFVAPVMKAFDGTATAVTPGQGDDLLTLFTAPAQTIRIADQNGALVTNDFLTQLGAFNQQIGGVISPGYLDDWDELIVPVLAGGFDWLLVSNGWNMVSAPQSCVITGGDGNFDAFDALQVAFAATADAALQMAMREPAGTYQMVDLTTPEAAAFDIDSVTGYWIYSEVAANVAVNFLAVDYGAGMNVYNAVPGWNLVGYTHNYAVWNAWPTASDFTDGTFGATMNTKMSVSMWNWGTQTYNSYVVSSTFPGMPIKDWVWDSSYSTQPGNGFWLWTDAAVTITFDVLY